MKAGECNISRLPQVCLLCFFLSNSYVFFTFS